MTPQDLFLLVVIAAAGLTALRLLVEASYGRAGSRLVTFYLPTGAVFVLAIHVYLVLHFDVVAPAGWLSVGAWGLVALTQGIAALAAWLPRSLPAQGDEVPVHDAQVLAKLEDVEAAVDKLTDERQEP